MLMQIDVRQTCEADPATHHLRAGRLARQLRSGGIFDLEWARAVKLWVDNRNLANMLVRTHFEVTIDPKSGLVTSVTCLECAAEDEKQNLNEAMAELQGLTPPPTSTPDP